VIRCFGTPARSNYLNPLSFLKEDYDFFVAQDLGMLPRNKLAMIFPSIKRKAKTILVVHTNKLRDDPSFYQTDREVLKYKNLEEFKENLRSIFKKDERYQICRKAAEEYAQKNSSEKIASKFLELFKKL